MRKVETRKENLNSFEIGFRLFGKPKKVMLKNNLFVFFH